MVRETFRRTRVHCPKQRVGGRRAELVCRFRQGRRGVQGGRRRRPSSPIYGTLTYGRQSALTSDGVVNYDPMGNSGAFSLIGFQGATGGGGRRSSWSFEDSS